MPRSLISDLSQLGAPGKGGNTDSSDQDASLPLGLHKALEGSWEGYRERSPGPPSPGNCASINPFKNRRDLGRPWGQGAPGDLIALLISKDAELRDLGERREADTPTVFSDGGFLPVISTPWI